MGNREVRDIRAKRGLAEKARVVGMESNGWRRRKEREPKVVA